MRERYERRRERKRRRCRLQKRAGKSCKREENYIRESSLLRIVDTDDESSINSSSYYDYYRQSAEMLSLLSLKKSFKLSRRQKGNSEKFDPG